MRGRTVRTNKKESTFLSLLKETGGNVTKACEAIGLNRQRVYEWRSRDAEFAAKWDDAVEAGTEELEQEARRRAYKGVDEPVFYQGEECGTVRKYSDTLLIFLLKGRKPEKYRDNVTVKIEDVDAEIERRLATMASRGANALTGEATDDTVH